MGIGMALVFWAIIGIVIATIGACVLGGLSFFLTRRVSRSRWPVVVASCVFPFLCLPWGAVVFGFQAVVNETFLHRDPGLGDAWRCPLPNGYSILMIDETDNGWVYNPRTQPGPGVGEAEDAVSGIQQLQLSGGYVLGDRNDAWGEGNPGQKISYFILDTSKGAHASFATKKNFAEAAAKLGVTTIQLEPIDVVYGRYRGTWFDTFAGFLFLVPPLVGFVGLVVWVRRVRKHGRIAQVAVPS